MIIHHLQVGATELTSNKEADIFDHTTNSRWRILQTNEYPIPLPLDKGFLIQKQEVSIQIEWKWGDLIFQICLSKKSLMERVILWFW